MVDVLSTATGILGSIFDVVLWVLIIGGILGIGYLLYNYFKYNKVIIIRKCFGENTKVFIDKARLYIDKDGVEWWKFLKLRKVTKIPPQEAIGLTSKAKEFAECYLTETGELSWIKNSNNTINNFEPFTTEDRQTLQYQFYKSKLEGGVNWKDYLIPIFYITGFVVIVISLLVFYEDMGKPLITMANAQNSYMDKVTQLVEKMDQVIVNSCNTEGGGTINAKPTIVPPN